MAGRRLHEILSEEQEPFALQSFIRERRRQLQPLAHLRSCSSVKRRSPFSCLSLSKIPFFSLQHRVSGRKRKKNARNRKGGANGRDDGPVSGVAGFLAKKLFARKRDFGAGVLAEVCSDNQGNGCSGEVPVESGNSCLEVAEEAAEARPASDCEVAAASCRCGRPDCPLYDGEGTSSPEPEKEETTAILSPSSPERFREGVAEKEQLSPVSVLDQSFYDEDERPRPLRGEEEDEDEDDDKDDSFRDRLAALERTKQDLLFRICSFERLTGHLHEDGDGSPDPVTARRVALWKGADAEIARRLVEADLPRESGVRTWRPELAVELSIAVFSALVYDLAVELCSD